MTTQDPIIVACLCFTGLFLTLSLAVGLARTGLVLARKRAANSFAVDGADISPFVHRLTRARDNYYENIGALALIVLVAFGLGRLDALNGLAYLFLGARIGQTTVHLLSGHNLAVSLRAAFYFTQVGIQIYWVAGLLWGLA